MTDRIVYPRRYTIHTLMEEVRMRSAAPKEVNIIKVIGNGELPGFIPLVHRHFQKAKPFVASATSATVIASTDLLDLIVPEKLLSQIESVEVVYEKGGAK